MGKIRGMIRVGWILLALTMPLRADPWRLVWSDEFSGQGPPDSSKWSTEKGFLRNEEKQYYTGDRPENVRQADGLLILECRREEFVTPDQGTVGFTSGSITTWDKASWRYGRFEIRAKMPRGKGTWASLWLMGVADLQGKPWPTCGEIDIAEHVGKEPEIYTALSTSRRTDGTGLRPIKPMRRHRRRISTFIRWSGAPKRFHSFWTARSTDPSA